LQPGEPLAGTVSPTPPPGLTEMEERARCRPIADEWELAQEDLS
jgi:hypothetical protein